jgi:hypothetical protein
MKKYKIQNWSQNSHACVLLTEKENKGQDLSGERLKQRKGSFREKETEDRICQGALRRGQDLSGIKKQRTGSVRER